MDAKLSFLAVEESPDYRNEKEPGFHMPKCTTKSSTPYTSREYSEGKTGSMGNSSHT